MVLFRSPIQVGLSLVYRTRTDHDAGFGARVWLMAALLSWTGSYAFALKFRDRLIFVDFEHVESEPQTAFADLARLTSLRFSPTVIYDHRNKFDGERPAIQPGPGARWALRHANALHETLRLLAIS